MNERVIIFGAGSSGELALRSLTRGQRAVAFCDNDHARHGSRFHGLPVFPPQMLPGAEYDLVLIASGHYAAIFEQLVGLGIDLRRIDVLDLDVMEGRQPPGPPRWRRRALAGWITAIVLAGLAAVAWVAA